MGACALGHQRQQLLDGQDRVATYWTMATIKTPLFSGIGRVRH